MDSFAPGVLYNCKFCNFMASDQWHCDIHRKLTHEKLITDKTKVFSVWTAKNRITVWTVLIVCLALMIISDAYFNIIEYDCASELNTKYSNYYK